ncbi:hypothetical protein DL769_006723 [Monosporascus sp. CRB-8-3]|nr:hypothetical protein DL769_006723 [Monosporascus sp. CRB-8-3]
MSISKPEAADKYLQSVLSLSRTWDCTALLDEAECSPTTAGSSSRRRTAWGTFDDAFKSRMQLALHYEKLDRRQRRQVLGNFQNHLKSLGGGDIDYDDVECYVSELAEYAINGREIRNSITTARKLAQFKGEKMNYTHLKQSPKIQSRFDRYLKDIREGILDEQTARDEGVE